MPAIAAKRVFAPLLIACLLTACPGPDEVPRNTLPAPPAALSPGAPPAGRAQVLPDFTQLVEAQGPTVVNVVTTRTMRRGGPGDPMAEFFRRFFPDTPPHGGGGGGGDGGEGGGEEAARGLGSGFIVSADGLILTNAHVVAEASSVTIRLADGKREFPAKVLGTDRRSDVALVKIEAQDLPVAKLGNSTQIKPGEWVAAIGSPFGFANTITAGIVSATNRELPDESIMPFIQTDVAVNPGNSGGPLINMSGQVVGINSMIYSGTGGYMGVSFAIPIEVALDVAKQLQEHGKVTRGRLGLVIQPVTPDLARAFGLEGTDGVVVGAVEPGGPAERGGLKSGDVILEYNGQPIRDAVQLPRLAAASTPGSTAQIVVWREGARRSLSVEVGEAPAERVAAQAPPEAQTQAANPFGLVLGEVPPAALKQLGIDFGLVIQSIQGPAETPLRRGDVIVAVNQARFSSLAEFNTLLARHKAGETVAFLVRRGNAISYVTVKVPA